MKQRWIGVILALTVAAVLTGCGGRGRNDATSDGQNSGTASQNGSGSMSQDIAGSVGPTEENTPSQSGMTDGATGYPSGSGTYTGRTEYAGTDNALRQNLPEQRGGENPFVKDGRYVANEDGRVSGRINPATRDFTQDARGMIRDVGRAVGDAGRSVGEAAADMGRSITDAARSAVGK